MPSRPPRRPHRPKQYELVAAGLGKTAMLRTDQVCDKLPASNYSLRGAVFRPRDIWVEYCRIATGGQRLETRVRHGFSLEKNSRSHEGCSSGVICGKNVANTIIFSQRTLR